MYTEYRYWIRFEQKLIYFDYNQSMSNLLSNQNICKYFYINYMNDYSCIEISLNGNNYLNSQLILMKNLLLSDLLDTIYQNNLFSMPNEDYIKYLSTINNIKDVQLYINKPYDQYNPYSFDNVTEISISFIDESYKCVYNCKHKISEFMIRKIIYLCLNIRIIFNCVYTNRIGIFELIVDDIYKQIQSINGSIYKLIPKRIKNNYIWNGIEQISLGDSNNRIISYSLWSNGIQIAYKSLI